MVTSKSVRGGPSWNCLFWCIAGLAFASANRAEGQQQPEVIVRNGLIVTDEGRLEADVRIRGERIVEIGPNLAPTAGA